MFIIPQQAALSSMGQGGFSLDFCWRRNRGAAPGPRRGELTKNGTAGMMNAGRTLLHNRRLAQSLAKGGGSFPGEHIEGRWRWCGEDGCTRYSGFWCVWPLGPAYWP